MYTSIQQQHFTPASTPICAALISLAKRLLVNVSINVGQEAMSNQATSVNQAFLSQRVYGKHAEYRRRTQQAVHHMYMNMYTLPQGSCKWELQLCNNPHNKTHLTYSKA